MLTIDSHGVNSPPSNERARTDPPSFDQRRRRTNVQGLKAAAMVALVVVSSFAVVEFYVVPDHFWLLQGLRVVCLSFLAATLVTTARNYAWACRHVDVLTLGSFLICGWYSIALMCLHGGYDSSFFLTLVFIIVGVGAVTLWPLWIAVLYNALVIVSYLVPLILGLVDLGSPDVFGIHLSFLLGMALIAIVAQQLRYQIERREFETNQQLQRTKASLEAAYVRLKELDEAKTNFFANVSHELRTPLTLSLGPLETLMRRPRPALEMEQLESLHRNQLRLLRLITQLLDFAKVDAGGVSTQFSRSDLGALTRSVVREVEQAAKSKEVSVQLIVPTHPIWVWCDTEKIEQVLLNLLSNAFKFTPATGRITVRLEEVGDAAELSVSDTGAGIPSHMQQAIFERFSQVDSSETRRYAGTGIGLALVESYVSLHRGSVRVESEEGKGSTFIVSLPRYATNGREGIATFPQKGRRTRLREYQLIDFRETDARDTLAPADAVPARTAGEEQTPPSPQQRSAPRVLIVDDNPDMRRYIASLLAGDYQVRVARDGAVGLRETEQWDPDVVVSDVMMPVMSGTEMCRAIKEAGGRMARTPVVLVTARAEEQAKLRSLDYGADDYLLKPFLQEELKLRIRNLSEKRRQERALLDAHLTLSAQHERLQSDIELARDFQHSLLSDLSMPAPLSAHVEFRPADVVGGDFYHTTSLAPHHVRVLLGDMVDHGVKAAVRAAVALPEYTSLDHSSLGPDQVLEHLNDLATSKYGDLSGSFLCLDLRVLRHDRVLVRYSQSGEMPFTLIADGQALEPPAAQGFMVGLFPRMRYVARDLVIPAHGRLFLYSDGLYTQLNPNGQTFRDESLAAAWRSAEEQSEIVSATRSVIKQFDEFRGSVQQQDDLTVIGIDVGIEENRDTL